MQYVSTRGGSVVSASEALVRGLAPDGGLYVPERFPEPKIDWCDIASISYAELASKVLQLFFPDWSKVVCDEMCQRAYKGTFSIPGIIRLREVGKNRFFTELFHGRTLAFKDLALSLFPHLLQQAKRDLGQQMTTLILTATSGDTGKAALEGFRDVSGTHILVFYPEYGVSPMQKAQMQTQQGRNVHVTGIKGNFDDAQSFLKEVFENEELRTYASEHGVHFSSANSINIGRLIPQVVYYIRSYTELVKEGRLARGEVFDVAVPTGNFGNILAGFFAKKLGVPIGKLICASNQNNVLADFFATGVYDRRRDFHVTTSPSMDILISSNFERFLYYILGENSERVRTLMESLKENGAFQLTETERNQVKDIVGGWIDDEKTMEIIADEYHSYGYLMDPHTAVAVGVAKNWQTHTESEKRLVVIMSTAHPYKFPETVAAAIDIKAQASSYDYMWKMANEVGVPIPCSFLQMQNLPCRFSDVIDEADMDKIVRQVIIETKEM